MTHRNVRTTLLVVLLLGAAACGGENEGGAIGEEAAPEDASAPVMEPGTTAPPVPIIEPDAPADTARMP